MRGLFMQAKCRIALLTGRQNCVTNGAFLPGGTVPPLLILSDFRTRSHLGRAHAHFHCQPQRQSCKFWEQTTPRAGTCSRQLDPWGEGHEELAPVLHEGI